MTNSQWQLEREKPNKIRNKNIKDIKRYEQLYRNSNEQIASETQLSKSDTRRNRQLEYSYPY